MKKRQDGYWFWLLQHYFWLHVRLTISGMFREERLRHRPYLS